MGTLSNKYPNAQAVENALNKGVDAYDNMGQIELVYNGTDIRFNNEVVNFQQIVDYITTDARFCYMVYNNRVLLTSDMQLTGGTRYVFFETSTTDSGLSKNTVVKVYSADGTTISSISHSTIANENFNNKVSTIAPNDKNSTVHYPNNKAVTEITDEIKEDLTLTQGAVVDIDDAPVENDVNYTVNNENCRFILNADYTKITSTSSSSKGGCVVGCTVAEGEIYRVTGTRGSDLIYNRFWALVDDNNNTIELSVAGRNTTDTEDIIVPENATRLYVNGRIGVTSIKNIVYEKTYTSKSYSKDETYSKTEVDNVVSEIKTKHKSRILVNFDDPLHCFTDGRHELCKKYRIPYTVNVTISNTGDVNIPNQDGVSNIPDMLADGVDFAVYSSKLPSDADNKYNDDATYEEWKSYVDESITLAETVGIFNPTAFFCRFMKTGTALNQALIDSGIRICRGYKDGVTPSESTKKYFDLNEFSNVDKQKFNLVSVGCNVTSNNNNPLKLLEYIDYAVENGLDIAPFAHGIYATEEEAISHSGTTRTILETVLSHIRDLVNEEVAEVCTFRDYYKLKYFCDGTMNDIARERKYSDWKYGQNG